MGTCEEAGLRKRSFLKTADQTAAQATSSGFRVRDRHLGIQTTIKSCERDDLRNGLIAHPAARILGILLEQRAASGQSAGPRVTQTRVQESPTAKKMSQRAAHRQPADSPVPQRRYQTAGKHISDRCCSIYDCRFCRGPGKSTSVSECRHRHADSLRGDGVTFVFDRPAVVVRLAINGSPADGICLLGLCDQSH